MAEPGQPHGERPETGRLREALHRCLAARRPAEITAASQACRLLLEEDLQSMASTWSQDPLGVRPDQAVSQLFAQRPHLVPLAALASLLEITAPLTEATWAGHRESLLYRPVLVRLTGTVMAAFAQAEMPPVGEPSPCLTDRNPSAMAHLPPALADIYGPGTSHEALAELDGLFEELAGHDLALRLTRREISVFDRIVFWSDTPAEAHEKVLASDRTALCEEIATRWLDLERLLRGKRGQVWPIHASDQTLSVRNAIRQISTVGGESSRPKDCPLFHQEQATWQTQSFANEVRQRFGPAWGRADLLERALSDTSRSDPPSLRESGFVDSSRAPDQLGPVLAKQGFPARLLELQKARAESDLAKDALRTAKGQVSTWERPNVFKESPAEAREQAMVSALSLGAERLEEMETAMRQELEAALARVHQPALVGLLLGELAEAVDAIRAECASTTKVRQDSGGDAGFDTVFFCVLRGMDEAEELLRRLMATTEAEPDTYLPLWEAAEMWALLDCPWAQSIHELSP